MASDWVYAVLTHTAKENGGPEAWIESLTETAKLEGKAEMFPLVGAALGVGSLATFIGMKLVEFFQEKRKTNPEEVIAAKEKLIQGIKEYDATHTSIEEPVESDIENLIVEMGELFDGDL